MILDLNADVGEGAGTDAELMPWITSANVCCGFHAGDAETSAKTLELAKKHSVVCGAHPGFADRANFGRKNEPSPSNTIYASLIHQISQLNIAARTCNTNLSYIKPHGALYNQAAAGPFANLFCSVVQNWEWPVVCLPGSEVEKLCTKLAIGFIPEGFADRRYLSDGSLVPRTEPNAVLHDPKEVVEQVEWLVREKDVQTICVHGDTPGAVEFVRKVRESLLAKGHVIRAFTQSSRL